LDEHTAVLRDNQKLLWAACESSVQSHGLQVKGFRAELSVGCESERCQWWVRLKNTTLCMCCMSVVSAWYQGRTVNWEMSDRRSQNGVFSSKTANIWVSGPFYSRETSGPGSCSTFEHGLVAAKKESKKRGQLKPTEAKSSQNKDTEVKGIGDTR
jgi:hypothetical protein